MYNPAFVSLLLPITIPTPATPTAIAGMAPFYTNGAMWAEKRISHTGSLELEDIKYQVTYTVYSYRQPIAEIVAELDVVHNILSLAKSINPNKYSRTTSKHQGYVRRAFDLMQ
jgi:hypothetical protein